LRTASLAVVVALALILTPSAAAQSAPLAIGDGHKPGVAVDPSGTAYIAWYGPEAGDTSLRFCRLARGATACAGQAVLPTTGSSLSRPFVHVAGARVTVLQYRYGAAGGLFNQVFLYTSLDGGDSFDGGAVVGSIPFDESVLGPGDTATVATNAFQEGGVVQNMPLSGGSVGEARAAIFPDRPYNGTVGLDGETPVAVVATGAGDAAFRRFAAGSVNDAAGWGAPVGIGYADYPRLAGGRSGLFLLAGTAAGGIEVRRWNGSTFADPVSLTASGDDAQASFSQDPAGRLHAVWPRFDTDGIHLVHAISDDGRSWDSGTLLVQATDLEAQTRVAAAADHIGVVVWESGGQIRVAASGPGAPGVPLPQFGKTVVLKPVSGKVRVRLKGARRFVALTEVDDVPLGSTVDTRKGRVELASVPSRAGAVEKALLYDGQFSVAQKRGITEFALNESLASCRRAGAAAGKPKTRKLWGDGKGRFRTKGTYSAATVRGTRWLVQDSCAGTLTRVTEGSVLVTAGRKRVVLRAGKQYLAKPRR
jgi:hypothetical protein